MADFNLEDNDGGSIIITDSVTPNIDLQDNDVPSIDISTDVKGEKGDPGVGVPVGGTSGQVLSKIDSTNYNTQWVNQSGGSGSVDSVNGQTGIVVLDTDDVSDSGATNKYVTAAEKVKISNLSGTNTGDQDLSGKVDKQTSVSTLSVYATDNAGVQSIRASSSSSLTSGTVVLRGTGGLIAGATPTNPSDLTRKDYVDSAVTGMVTLTGVQTLTNKDLTSGTNTFPTFNQNTTGSAATLTTARTIGTQTGDVTSAGSTFNGSANNTNATVLATVNSNVGSFGSASSVSTQTVNAKGLTTAAASVAIQIAESQVTNLVTDLAAKQGTITLTTTGTSGAATLVSNTLNIPQYSGGGGGSGTVGTGAVNDIAVYSGTNTVSGITNVRATSNKVSIGTGLTAGALQLYSSGLGDSTIQASSGSAVGAVHTLPDATSTLVGAASSQTLTNKTIVAGSNSITGLGVTNFGGVTGTASSSTYLRGDNTWATVSGGGGISRSVATSSANNTLGSTALTDYVSICTGVSTYTTTLPTAVGNTNQYTITNGSTANQNIATTSGQTINGNASMVISPNSTREFISDNANWRVL